MWTSRWRCVIKPAYSFSFLLSINIFVWQNVLYFPNDHRKSLQLHNLQHEKSKKTQEKTRRWSMRRTLRVTWYKGLEIMIKNSAGNELRWLKKLHVVCNTTDAAAELDPCVGSRRQLPVSKTKTNWQIWRDIAAEHLTGIGRKWRHRTTVLRSVKDTVRMCRKETALTDTVSQMLLQ